jgi:hypothetical protein
MLKTWFHKMNYVSSSFVFLRSKKIFILRSVFSIAQNAHAFEIVSANPSFIKFDMKELQTKLCTMTSIPISPTEHLVELTLK